MTIKLVKIKENILKDNEEMSKLLKGKFRESKTLVVNLMSSPGAGKTSTILETFKRLGNEVKVAVIEGDITSTVDAEKMEKAGIPVIQINTDGACHLDSAMVAQAIEGFDTSPYDLIIVENVGNLVCPAEFEVGEDLRVMILSIPEGHDKPKKYPLMFMDTTVCLLNKIDLAPYTDFDVKQFRESVMSLNPDTTIFEISVKTGEGMDGWVNWLNKKVDGKKNG